MWQQVETGLLEPSVPFGSGPVMSDLPRACQVPSASQTAAQVLQRSPSLQEGSSMPCLKRQQALLLLLHGASKLPLQQAAWLQATLQAAP